MVWPKPDQPDRLLHLWKYNKLNLTVVVSNLTGVCLQFQCEQEVTSSFIYNLNHAIDTIGANTLHNAQLVAKWFRYTLENHIDTLCFMHGCSEMSLISWFHRSSIVVLLTCCKTLLAICDFSFPTHEPNCKWQKLDNGLADLRINVFVLQDSP